MDISGNSKTFLAPAKVNLILKVLHKRDDGYHELYTIFQAISLYDELEISLTKGDDIVVTSDSMSVPDGPDNLVYRAVQLFFKEAGSDSGAVIRLKKRIPVGAGLGGGSSDAACTLLGLNELCGSLLGQDALMRLAGMLGSDVPFFIMGGSVIGRGRGEVLEPIDIPLFDYVLVNPGFEVSTAKAYANLDLTKINEDNKLTYSTEAFEDPLRLVALLSNDLEAVTERQHPRIGELKRMLLDNGAAGALMSGSGPTVFGVFRRGQDAKRAYEALKNALDSSHAVFLAHGL